MKQFVSLGRSFFSPQKTEERVRFSMALAKLAALVVIAIILGLLGRLCKAFHIRWRGINPSAFCLTDSSHLFFSTSFNALMQLPFLRKMLLMLSSFMVDAAFVYFAASWYVSSDPGSWATAPRAPDASTP